MAEKKASLLKGMLKQPAQPTQPAQQVIPQGRADMVRGTGYRVGMQDDDPLTLSAEINQLSDAMQEYARRYVESRRRSGAALLEAARWLQEARDAAKHGEWGIFLEATNTQEHTATELLNLHTRAMEDPRFAEAVRTNWLGASVAGLLARPSTPPEVLEQALRAEAPPKATEIRQAIKAAKGRNAGKADDQILEIPGFDASAGGEHISALDMLKETTKALIHLERSVGELPGTRETTQALTRARQAIDAITRAIEARG